MAVYLIQGEGGGLVKIGKANDPVERVWRQIQRFSPVRLVVLAAAAGGRRLEARLHRKYAVHRRWGEWFDLPSEELERLKESMDEHPDRRWVLVGSVQEMKRFVDDIRNNLKRKSRRPGGRDWLAGSLSRLRAGVSRVAPLVWAEEPKRLVDDAASLVDDMATKVRGDRFSLDEEGEWLTKSLGGLRELMSDLWWANGHQLWEEEKPVPPPPCKPVIPGRAVRIARGLP